MHWKNYVTDIVVGINTVRSKILWAGSLNNRTTAIYRPTHYLSTINQQPSTHQVSFVYFRQCTSYKLFLMSVFFIRHGWRKWTESCHKISFQSSSCCPKMRPLTKLQVFANFWPKKNVTTLYHPLYSPDSSPPDYFLFLNLKMKLKGLHFVDVAVIQETVTDYLFLNINQLDALNFIISLFHASTCFEHMCSSSGGQNCTIESLVSSQL